MADKEDKGLGVLVFGRSAKGYTEFTEQDLIDRGCSAAQIAEIKEKIGECGYALMTEDEKKQKQIQELQTRLAVTPEDHPDYPEIVAELEALGFKEAKPARKSKAKSE
jgi:hypothetical protein